MTTETNCKVYEQLATQPFASAGIRPGGLELTRRALVLSKLERGARILDVGCGTGVTVNHLIRTFGINAVGLDSSPTMLSRTPSRDAAPTVLAGDAHALPFADGSFDGLMLECTLSLCGSGARVLDECRRVLSPGGVLTVTDVYARHPGAIELLRALPFDSCLKGALEKGRFLEEVSAAGLVPICFEDHSILLRSLAIDLIWTYGSLERFWSETTGSDLIYARVREAVRKTGPGYFLYLGRKVGGPNGLPAKEFDHEPS